MFKVIRVDEDNVMSAATMASSKSHSEAVEIQELLSADNHSENIWFSVEAM